MRTRTCVGTGAESSPLLGEIFSSSGAMSSTQVEDLVLLRVDEECANLQAEGHYLEALDYMERSLVLRRCLYASICAVVITRSVKVFYLQYTLPC